MLKEQISKWKKEAQAKDIIIKKLRNSDGYTMTAKSGTTGSTGASGTKLKGHDFGKFGN